MKIKAIALVAAALVAHAQAATYSGSKTYFSSTNQVGSSFVNLFEVAKLNLPDAVITGITVSVIAGELQGFINVTNTGADPATLTEFDSSFTARQFTSGLGYVQTTDDIATVLTNPDWQSTSLQPGVLQSFTVLSGQQFSIDSQSIDEAFWDAYVGEGTVTFSARNARNVSITGDDLLLSTGGLFTTAQFAVTYDYLIPEPATALLGGLGFVMLLRRRR